MAATGRDLAMLADYEATFHRHDDTIRRAEANARLLAALTPQRPPHSEERRPRRRLVALLRWIARTPATA